MKRVGLITIHGINNFGSLCQAYATQRVIEDLGYECEIINYKYPNEYHTKKAADCSPYAKLEPGFMQRVRLHYYRKFFCAKNIEKKSGLYKKCQEELLHLSKCYESKEKIAENPPIYDIYLTGSDQVWNPRYLYEDMTFFLPFASKNKIAFSASFGTTEIDEMHQQLMRPLLQDYLAISTRELSGVEMVKKICNRDAICTCDPTLLLSGNTWGQLFDDKPIVDGDYILCYILTYTANPYPYAYKFVCHIKKLLRMKVVFIDEEGYYWGDLRHKSFQVYGPREIINLFKNSKFVISSSFHGAAFSLNFRKSFYSIFPRDVKDERQESLLKIVGATGRFIRVGDSFPVATDVEIKNWNDIGDKLREYVSLSTNYLRNALELCAK